MSIADDTIADVIALIERPDLVVQARNMMRRALLQFHNADNFARDMVELDIPVLVTDTARSDSLPLRFRQLARISALKDGVCIAHDFKERKGELLKDYFGFLVPNTWMVLGNNLRLNWLGGADTIRITYYSYPEWLVTGNVGEETVTCDSWILQEYDQGVMFATLSLLGMGVDKIEEANRWAASAEKARRELIATYSTTGLSDND